MSEHMEQSLVCEEHPNLEWPHDDCPGPGMPASAVAEELLRRRTDVRRLGSALEPFAKLGKPEPPHTLAFHDLPDDVVVYANSGECITAGDVRQANAALEAIR